MEDVAERAEEFRHTFLRSPSGNKWTTPLTACARCQRKPDSISRLLLFSASIFPFFLKKKKSANVFLTTLSAFTIDVAVVFARRNGRLKKCDFSADDAVINNEKPDTSVK